MATKRKAPAGRAVPISTPSLPPPAPELSTGQDFLQGDRGRVLVRFTVVVLALFFFRWIVVPDAKAPLSGRSSLAPADPPQGVQALGYDFDGIPALRGSSGWGGAPKLNESIMGGPMTLGGKVYSSGIGTHAPSEVFFALNARATRFKCLAGVDARGNDITSLYLIVKGDGRKLYQSPLLGVKSPPVPIDLDVTGVKQLVLEVDPAGDRNWDQADWVNLRFVKTSP